MNLEEQKGTSVLVEIIGKQGKEIEELANSKKSYWDWYEREKKEKEALELKIKDLQTQNDVLVKHIVKVGEVLEGTKQKEFLELKQTGQGVLNSCKNE